MSMTFAKESENIFVVYIKGILTFENLKEVEKSGREQINRGGKVKLLVLAGEFSGWGKEGDWGDLTFMHEHDQYIEKIAVVADEKWQDQILMFLGAGRRNASVEHFSSDEVEDARDWLDSESE